MNKKIIPFKKPRFKRIKISEFREHTKHIGMQETVNFAIKLHQTNLKEIRAVYLSLNPEQRRTISIKLKQLLEKIAFIGKNPYPQQEIISLVKAIEFKITAFLSFYELEQRLYAEKRKDETKAITDKLILDRAREFYKKYSKEKTK